MGKVGIILADTKWFSPREDGGGQFLCIGYDIVEAESIEEEGSFGLHRPH